jgi:fermentation-respiration switch protein FrsA (DUF1100 family)
MTGAAGDAPLPHARARGTGVLLRGALLLLPALQGCVYTVAESSFLRADHNAWPVSAVDPSYRVEQVTLRQSDGNPSHGLFLSRPSPKGTILYLQGGANTLDAHGATRLWQYRQMGYNAYVFERRGYGHTPGTPTLSRLLSDAREAYDFVRARTEGPLILHGFSMGSTLAAEVVRERHPDVLVIEGGTPSVRDYVATKVPWYARPVLKVKLAPQLQAIEPASALRHYQGPLLIAVGEKDPDTVPALSRALYAAAGSPTKELLVVPGAGHYALGSPQGFAPFSAFLERHVGQ